MESRDNGCRLANGNEAGRSPQLRSIGSLLSRWPICIALLFVSIAHAQTHYVYDANGRVVAITQSNGTSTRYTYDTLGHLAKVGAPISAGQPAIFAFTPTHGVAGTQVTIQGQGFSPSAASDGVSFNGAAATVMSASANQLIVAVPSGASTGPISVTGSTQAVSSTTPFVIDDTGLPPTIDAVTPIVTAIGSTVTVAGTHLDPVPGHTTLEMDGRDVSLTAVADAQLQFSVPDAAIAGYVDVATPYGSATSTTPIAILPSAVTQADVVSSGYAPVNGSPVDLNIGAGGQTGAVVFTAMPGQWLSLQTSDVTTTANTISYSVYAPGDVLVQQGIVSAAIPSIHLPQLTEGGTYLVTFTPDTGGAQLAVGVVADVTLNTNVMVTVATTVPGQSQRLLFNASAGQTLTFVANNPSTLPTGQSVFYTVYTTTGAIYTSGSSTTTGLINLPDLPTTGTYQILVGPNSGVTATLQVEIVPGVFGTIPTNGDAQSYATTLANQNVYLSFTANAGDNLELTLNQLISVGGGGQINVSVYGANGVSNDNYACYTSNPGASCTSSLWDLAAGTYTVVVTPSAGSTISFNTLLQPDVIGPAMTLNAPTSVNLGAGQVQRLTFAANAGDTVALQLSGVNTLPAGQTVGIEVFQPGVGALTTATPYLTYLTATSSNLVNLPNLPLTGHYTVVVFTAYGEPGSVQLTVVPGVTGTIATTGTSQSYTANVANQDVFLTFSANAGDNLELTLNQLSSAGGSGQINVNVYGPNGVAVDNYTCYTYNPGASCNSSLWDLAAGNYSVVVTPSAGSTISFNTLLQPDVIGPAMSLNVPATVNLGAGQVQRLTFAANAGDTIALQLSGVSTVPAGQTVGIEVFEPGVGVLTTATPYLTYFTATTTNLVNLPNLPLTGNYTVVVFTAYGEPGDAQVTLVPGVTGTIATTGVSQSYAANVPDQDIYLTFSANTGDSLELTLNQLSSTGGSGQINVNVYGPNGVAVDSYACYTSNPGASCNSSLWDLAAGAYSVVITPSAGGTISFNTLLQPDVIGPVMSLNAPTTVNLGAGQVQRLTFAANAGDTVAVQLSGVNTIPAGQTVGIEVFEPGVGVITTSTSYLTYFTATTSNAVSLSNLPLTGSYTVVVFTAYGEPGSAQVTVTSQ